jgi:hypothetical protein
VALTVITWFWGNKYSRDYVTKLAAGLRRNLKQPFRFALVADNKMSVSNVDEVWSIDDPILLRGPGCFARLRMFDPLWQKHHDIEDRLVSIDLDTVITGQIDHLFDRPESFVIIRGGNAANPCPFNGAMQMLRPGAHSEVWKTFSLEASQKVPYLTYPDDQAWLAHKLPNAAGWQVGAEHGVYVFRKPGWPGYIDINTAIREDALPEDARLVTFSGRRSPESFSHLSWVKENWHE